MDQYIVQPFLPHGRGMKAGKPIAAGSETAAIAEARRLGAQFGAAAVHIEYEVESGITNAVRVLAKIGTLPDDFDETVGA